MAQIHALTPEGRLPTAAQEHVGELIEASPAVTHEALTAGIDWDTLYTPTGARVFTQFNHVADASAVHAPAPGRYSIRYEALTTTSGTMTALLWQSVTPRIYTRTRASGSWSGWSEFIPPSQLLSQAAATTNLNALPRSTTTPTIHQASNTPTDWVGQNYPAPVPGIVTDTPLNTGRSIQVFQEFGGKERVWKRYQIGGTTFGAWAQIDASKPVVGAATTRHQLLADDLNAHAGGGVGTGGATPVALTWDDYPAAFRDKVLPLLTARGIPATLAAVSGWYGDEQEWLGAAGTTWAEIDGWPVEIACHSATHGNAPTRDALLYEIVESKAALEAFLPSKQIQCFIQPAANYGPGFNNGDSLSAYADTEAGTLLLSTYGLVTGTRNPLGTYGIPRNGTPFQGMTRSWIDSGAAPTQTRITALAGTGQGIIVGAHANRLDTEGWPTTADLAAFLDWLVAEQAAGRIRLLTLSEWAVADTRFPA